MYTTSTLSLNRPVTLPPGLYKARQGPFSLITHHLVITSNQSRATWHTGRRVFHLAARTCLNCVLRVSSFELPISARPHSSTLGTPLGRLPV
jgi:hypothetical protein